MDKGSVSEGRQVTFTQDSTGRHLLLQTLGASCTVLTINLDAEAADVSALPQIKGAKRA